MRDHLWIGPRECFEKYPKMTRTRTDGVVATKSGAEAMRAITCNYRKQCSGNLFPLCNVIVCSSFLLAANNEHLSTGGYPSALKCKFEYVFQINIYEMAPRENDRLNSVLVARSHPLCWKICVGQSWRAAHLNVLHMASTYYPLEVK